MFEAVVAASLVAVTSLVGAALFGGQRSLVAHPRQSRAIQHHLERRLCHYRWFMMMTTVIIYAHGLVGHEHGESATHEAHEHESSSPYETFLDDIHEVDYQDTEHDH